MLKLNGEHGSYMLQKQVNKGGFSKIYLAEIVEYISSEDDKVKLNKGDKVIIRIVEESTPTELKLVKQYVIDTRKGESNLKVYD
jgi:hypothetical protein